MNILVIKQTSLGDVLHSTGHVRAIKEAYPHAHLTVLTSVSCAQIFRNHRSVDRIVQLDRDFIKQHSLCDGKSVRRHFADVLKSLKQRDYDLAFDLQGLWRSVYFLYRVKAKQKYVKGNFLGLKSYRDKSRHALEEMNGVLALAGISFNQTQMQFDATPSARLQLGVFLEQQNIGAKPLIVISPFTRWKSKDWTLAGFIALAEKLCAYGDVVLTGTEQHRVLIDKERQRLSAFSAKNWAGSLTLEQLSALLEQTALMVTGDSFPMHLAAAKQTPLVALFGPTDERKTGPLNKNSQVVRVNDCSRCDKPKCPKDCLKTLSHERVLSVCLKQLGHGPARPSNVQSLFG